MSPSELQILRDIHTALEEIAIYICKPLMFDRTKMLTAIQDIDKSVKDLEESRTWIQDQLAKQISDSKENSNLYNSNMWNIVYDQVLEREYEFTMERLIESFDTAVNCGYMPVKLHIYVRHLDVLYSGTEFLVKDHPNNPNITISGHKIYVVLMPENTPMPFKGASFGCIRLHLRESEAP